MSSRGVFRLKETTLINADISDPSMLPRNFLTGHTTANASRSVVELFLSTGSKGRLTYSIGNSSSFFPRVEHLRAHNCENRGLKRMVLNAFFYSVIST